MRKRLGFLLALLGLSGCRTKETTGRALALPSPDAQGVYPFTTNALFALYEADGREADRLLRGKPVLVTGWVVRQHTSVEPDVERLKRGERTPPDLYLHVGHESNGFYLSSAGIICTFPEDARPALRALLKKLDARESVTVRGIVDGKMGSVFLKDCSLRNG